MEELIMDLLTTMSPYHLHVINQVKTVKIKDRLELHFSILAQFLIKLVLIPLPYFFLGAEKTG